MPSANLLVAKENTCYFDCIQEDAVGNMIFVVEVSEFLLFTYFLFDTDGLFPLIQTFMIARKVGTIFRNSLWVVHLLVFVSS